MDNSRSIPELQYMVKPDRYEDRGDWYKIRCWTTRRLKRGDTVTFVDGSYNGETGTVTTGRTLKPQGYGVHHVRKLDE